jgi:methionine synthase I (cobalamin-dependent)
MCDESTLQGYSELARILHPQVDLFLIETVAFLQHAKLALQAVSGLQQGAIHPSKFLKGPP